jgi:hypothetical protein
LYWLDLVRYAESDPGRRSRRSRVVRVSHARTGLRRVNPHASTDGHGNDQIRLAQRQPRLNATQRAMIPSNIQRTIKAPAPVGNE